MSEASPIAILVAYPGDEEALTDALERLLGTTQIERGMLQYDAYRDAQGPRRLVFNKRWDDQKAFRAHYVSPHVVNHLQRTKGWIQSNVIYVLKQGKSECFILQPRCEFRGRSQEIT
jgi:quinol monooxygenase YgiN